MAEIVIRGETYSLDKVPDESSTMVKEEEERLFEAISKTLDYLYRAGAFIRIAYNGVGAAGPKFTDQQIEIQRLGYGAAKLYSKSVNVIENFKTASSRISSDLQSTHKLLLDNLALIAIMRLSEVSEIAGDMEKAAHELHEDFFQLEKQVVNTLEKMQKAKGVEAQHITDMQKQLAILQLEKEQQQALMEDQKKAEQEATARRREREQQEDRAIVDMSSTGFGKVLKRLCNALTSKIPVFGFEAFDIKASDVNFQAVALRDAIQRAYEIDKELCRQRQASLTKMTEFLSKILEYEMEEKMAEIAEGALHQAISALKELSLVTMHEAAFWKQLYEHCKSMSKNDMQKQVQTAMMYSKEDQLKVWTSGGFKLKAIEFHASWVALQGVCRRYAEVIKITEKDFYNYIKENPTYEQSRENVKKLAKEYLEDFQGDQKALEDKDFESS